MNLVIITPVGPGHGALADEAVRSVRQAKPFSGLFSKVEHVLVDDRLGEFGRGAARNIGMRDRSEADWYFFLDADDRFFYNALLYNDFSSPATFGAVCKLSIVTKRTRISRSNVFPCGWNEILKYGAKGTLSMGFFVRGDIARELKFNEDMIVGEDFDFYIRLPSFVKCKNPLVRIGSNHPPATGPKGYKSVDWQRECSAVIDLHRDAILAKTSMVGCKSGSI